MNKVKEKIWNIPNFLSISRIVVAFIVIYFIFADFKIIYIVSFFILGMLTDCLDGHIARKYKITTDFGRKLDMLADRFFLLSIVFAAIIRFSGAEIINRIQLLQMFIILSREIISFPSAFVGIITGKEIPNVRKVGKITTLMQAITFPMILFSLKYPFFNISIYFAIVTFITGFISALYYIKDMGRSKDIKRI